MFKGKKSTKDLVHGGASPVDTSTDEIEQKKGKKEKPPKEKRPKGERNAAKAFFRSKVLWGSLSIVAALVIAFVVVPMRQSQVAALAPVVVLTRDVELGEQVTQDMLRVVEIGAAGIPQGAVTDSASVVGMYMAAQGLAGDILTDMRITTQYPTDDPTLLDLPEGKVAMAVSLGDLSQNVASKLRAGDVIQLFAVLDDVSGDNTIVSAMIIPELRAVEVLSVTNSNAEDVKDRDQTWVETQDDRQVSAVVLAVTPQQAAVLSGLEEKASLHAALVVRGDPEKKAAALAAQDEFLSSEVIVEPLEEEGEEGDAT